jgi:hypothetical protein
MTPIWLAAARLGVGLLFLLRTTRLAAHLPMPYVSPDHFLLGWPDARDFTFAVMASAPAWVVAAACVLRTLAALCFAAGWWTRPAGTIAGLSAYFVAAQDPLAFTMTMHTLFLATIVLAWTDAGSRFALRPTVAQALPSSHGLVRIWVASIYAWAGIAKLHHDWLSGDVLRMLMSYGTVRGPLAIWLAASPRVTTALAPAIAFGEISLALALLHRRTRVPALLAAYAIHAGFESALAPDLFGWTMACLLLSFLGDLGPWREVFRAHSTMPRAARTDVA